MNELIFRAVMFAFAFNNATGDVSEGRIVGKFPDAESCSHAILGAESIIQETLDGARTARAFCAVIHESELHKKLVAPPGGAVL